MLGASSGGRTTARCCCAGAHRRRRALLRRRPRPPQRRAAVVDGRGRHDGVSGGSVPGPQGGRNLPLLPFGDRAAIFQAFASRTFKCSVDDGADCGVADTFVAADLAIEYDSDAHVRARLYAGAMILLMAARRARLLERDVLAQQEGPLRACGGRAVGTSPGSSSSIPTKTSARDDAIYRSASSLSRSPEEVVESTSSREGRPSRLTRGPPTRK